MSFLDYEPYVKRLARRLVRFRRSSMIDENDLVSAAMSRLWEVEQQKVLDEPAARLAIKYAMLDVLRKSAMVSLPRSTPYKQAIAAYTQLSAAVEPRGFPVDSWVENEPVREVAAIIESFPYEDKLLLSLIWEEGCSLQDVAEILSVSKSRIHQRYRDLIAKIQSRILVDRRKTK